MTTWQVQSAKQRFSELVRAAEKGEPQFITRHGEPVAVVIDISEYRATHAGSRPSMKDFLATGPSWDTLELPPRELDADRSTRLFEE